jgi:hypothetical protein
VFNATYWFSSWNYHVYNHRRLIQTILFLFLTATNVESLGMLEAFFIGRALAETVNERLGSVVGDVVAEIGKLEAELRRSIQYVEREIFLTIF